MPEWLPCQNSSSLVSPDNQCAAAAMDVIMLYPILYLDTLLVTFYMRKEYVYVHRHTCKGQELHSVDLL